MKTTITFEIDASSLDRYTDEYLAAYWHVSQANPASYGDKAACELAEAIKTEILRRWLLAQPPMLHSHKISHVALSDKLKQADVGSVIAG